MTRRPRITTVDEADAAQPRLKFLRHGVPQVQEPVRDLMDCCAVYRAEIYRLQKLLDGHGTGHFQRMVTK